MSKFVQIYLYSFIWFIFLSLLGNIFFPSFYSGVFIFFVYVTLLLSITYIYSKKDIRAVFLFFFGAAGLGYLLLYPIKDGTWDGSTYHLEILWNFIQGFPFLSRETIDIWSHVYPKNQEILLSIFASIDPLYTDLGRIFKFILLGVTISAVYSFTHREYPKFRNYGKFFILFGILLHPLILAQWFTKYIDDMLYLFFILYVLSFFSRQYLLSILLIAVFIGSKLNYVIYIFLSFPLLVYVTLKLRNITLKTLIQEISLELRSNKWKTGFIFFMGGALASYTYILNFIHYGNPLYPLLGNSRIEVVANNLPVNLRDSSKFIAHFFSLFSYSLSDFTQNAVLINPFSSDFLPTLLKSYKNIEVDTRMSGFGSLWSVAFFISLFHIPLIWRYKKGILWVSGTLFLFLLFMPFAWARFLPFIYLFPIIIGVGITGKYRKYYLGGIIILFFLNIIGYSGSYLGRFYFHNGIQNIITEKYIKKEGIRLTGYYPGKKQGTQARRISDITQNELYHLNYRIPVIGLSDIASNCTNSHIEELFNKGSGIFDVFRPMVVSCDDNNLLIRTRGYLYQDFFVGKK